MRGGGQWDGMGQDGGDGTGQGRWGGRDGTGEMRGTATV